MSKILKIIIPIVAVVIAAVSVVVVVLKDDPTYEIDATGFESVVAFEDDVDLSGIKIIEKEKENKIKEIPVDDSMVKTIDPTTSVGDNKVLILEYADEEFSLTFSVKYKIEFVVDEATISTQFILNANEIVKPENPKKTGYEFIDWNPVVPTVVNNNMTLNAQFTDVPTNVPNLGSYEAEYSDLLASIELPYNKQGRWEFVDTLDTTVGEIGKNIFKVQFIPTNNELSVLKDEIVINVSKKKLEFKNLVTSFSYNSLEQIPTYTLDVEGVNVEYSGQKGIAVGSYFYAFKIVDEHYEGSCMGYYEINESYITIDVESPAPITFGDVIPEIKYTVTGIADPSVLEIEVVYPNANRAGEYELTVIIKSESKDNFNIIINKGILVVNKANLEVSDPEFTTEAVYLNKLSSVEILNDNPNGYWTWIYPDTIFTAAGKYSYDLKFIPNSSNFEEITKTVEINVAKRQVEFNILNNKYVYDGSSYEIEYEIIGLEAGINVQVEGNIEKISAGNYPVTLQINDNNYIGTVGTTLIISKAVPSTDFTRVFTVEVDSKLSDILLPKGYSWNIGSTVLATVGENQEFEAKYTPVDTVNYEVISGKFVVNVIKKQSAIYGVKNNYEFDYNGGIYVLEDITSNPSDVELQYKYEMNGSELPSLCNAGTYNVTITLPETEKFYESVVTTIVTINQIKGSKPSTYTATYGDTLGSIILPPSDYGVWSWEEGNDTLVGDAGNQTHKAIFIATNSNYSNDEATVTIIVGKKSLNIEILENEYTYDGTPKSIIYRIENDLDLNVVINNGADNGIRTNAGTYQFSYVINDSNYYGQQTVELKINKAKYTPNWPTYTVDWNTTAFNISLGAGYKFNSDYVFDTVGTMSYAATYTPSDTTNYEIATGEIVVTVNKLIGSIIVNDNFEFTYGDNYIFSETVNHMESSLEITYMIGDEEVEKITDAGVYKVILLLPESEHYTEAVKEIEVVVKAKEVDVIWTNDIEGYFYKPNGQTPITAYYNDINGNKVYLTLTEANQKEFMNVGDYSYSVTSKDSNYVLKAETTTLDVAIEKATLDMNGVAWNYDSNSNYIYNGSEYKVELNNLPDAVIAEYSGNIQVNAGTDYVASVKLSYDTENYNADGIDQITDLKWSISKANTTVSWDKLNEYIYKASEYDYPTATINSVLRAVINLNVELINAESFINAGTYRFEASDSTGNYNLSDSTLDIIISPMSVKFDWEEKDYTYTGDVLSYPTVSFENALGENVFVTPTCDVEFKNYGDYVFSAIYNDSNYSIVESTLSKKYTISKAKYNMDDVKWNYEVTSPYTYNGSEFEVTVSGLPEGVTVKEYQNNKATNMGQYIAVAILDYDMDNHEAPTNPSIIWVINAKEVEVEWNAEATYIYGTEFSVPTASYKDVNGKIISLDVTEKNNKTFKDVDSYTFIADFADNDNSLGNYKLSGPSIDVEVKQATVGSLASISATYGDTLADIESKLPTSDYGTWSFKYDDLASVLVGNVGGNTFDVSFTSKNDNYESFDSTVVINVAKKLLTINIKENVYTYNGNEHTISYNVTGFVNEENIEAAGVKVLGNITGTNVLDSKDTTLSLEADNYYAVDVKTRLTINKATATIANTMSDFDNEYSGSPFVIQSSYFEVSSGATPSYTVTQNGVVSELINAGTYTITVSAPATDNYLAPENLIITYEITKIDPVLEYTGGKEFTYGDNITITASTNSDNDGNISYTYYLVSNGSETKVSAVKEAGTYKVVATVSESTNYNEKTITIDNIVVKKDSLDLSQLAEINAVYGQTLADFEFTQPDNGTWSWSDELDTMVGKAGADVTHQAKFTPNDLDNYEIEYQDVKFNISPATLTITINTSVFAYDESTKTVSYTVTGFVNGDTIEDVTVNVSSGSISETNVGEYLFVLDITGNSNYTGTQSGTLRINQGNPIYTVPTFEATYGDTYGSIASIANEGTEGSWTIDAEATALVGDAGTKNVTATFTPSNSNYMNKTVTTTLNVNKATYTTALPTSLTATYGDKLSTVKLVTEDNNGSWSWVDTDPNTTVGNAGSRKHLAVFTINDNYIPYEAELTIEVAKADSVISNNLSSLTYTGEELLESSGKITLNHSEAELVYTVTKDGLASSVINVGTYRVVVYAEATNNYNGTDLTIENLVVAQATPETDFEGIECSAYWNEKLSVITLPEGYSFAYPNTTLNTVGENQKFAAIYTPSDTKNYKTVTGNIYVTVNKIVGSIKAENQEFTYDINNTTGFVLEAETNNIENNTINYSYVLNGSTVSSIIDAGTYTVILTVVETEHYTEATKTITVVVNQAYEEIIVADTISYGATISDVSANASTYGTIVITDTNPNAAVSLAAVEDFLGSVGEEVTLYAIFTPYEEYANNFAAFVKEIKVTIVKKELTFTNVVSTYTYDGTAKTITYTLDGLVDGLTTADITVTGNVSATTVAQSVNNVILTIVSDNYYGEYTTNLVINKAIPVISDDFAAITCEINWNKTLGDITLPAGYTFNSASTTSVGEVGVNSFAATYTPEDTDNYEIVTGTIVVTVKRLKTTITVSSYNNLTYIKDKTYNVTASVNHNETTTINVSITYNGESVDVLSNAGTYNVVVTATQSAHYEAAELETTITIAQATPTTDFTDVFTVKWSNDLTLSNITLDSGYTWANPSQALSNAEIGKANTYKVVYTPADTVNYKTVEGTFTVTVVKADASITADAVYTVEYTGSAITLSNVKPSHTETSVIYQVDGSNIELISVGEYNITIVLPESTHYNQASITVKVTITKANVKFPEMNYTATYLETLGTLALPTSTYGTWAWKEAETTLVGDAGTQSHLVVFTPFTEFEANYNVVTVAVNITVNKIVTEVTNSIPTNLVYDGSTYNPSSWFTMSHNYGSLLVTSYLNNQAVAISNAGTYKLVVSLAETTNVSGYSEEFEVIVAQAVYTPTIIPTASATYGDTLSVVDFVGGDASGTWTWISSTDLVGGAGTRTHNAKFTPSDTNYAASTHQVTVTVAKKTLIFVNVVNEFGYNGNVQYIKYEFEGLVSGDTKPAVTGNTGLTTVGSNTFTLTVNDDNYSGTDTISLTIIKGNPIVTWPEYSGTYYEGRIDISTDYTQEPNSLVAGEFSYGSQPVYGDTTVKVTFTPTDKTNYNTISNDVAITISPVAFNSNDTYFGTVEKALSGTTSGTVNVIVGTNPIINDDVIVLAGVTLFIPHTDKTSVRGNDKPKAEYHIDGTMNDAQTEYIYTFDSHSTDKNGSYGTYDAGNYAIAYSNRLKNTVTLSNGVTLTNYGTIEIAGQLSGGGGGSNAAGQTYGLYSRILLEDNAQIISEGTINCYGYIEESSPNNGSKVTSTAGTIYMPFVIRDFKGGSQMYGLYSNFDSHHSSPFNLFELPNITSKIRIEYNAQLIGWANLYANSSHNATNINLIGTTSSHLIQMKDSTYSYVEAKYNRNGTNDGVCDLDLYGGATINKMAISVKVLTTITVSTEKVYFPLTYKFDISLNHSTGQPNISEYVMNNRYKLMPGHKMEIGQGARLTASDLIVYSYFDNSDSGMAGNKYPMKSPAQLTVNGELIATNLAGTVLTNEDKAKLTITGSTSITSYEPKTFSGSSIFTKITSWYDIVEKFNGYTYDGSSTSKTTTELSAGTYYSKDGGWRVPLFNITYNNIIDAEGEELGEITNNNPTSYTDIDIISLSIPNSSNSSLEFVGWYLDKECSIPISAINGADTLDNIILYAKWQLSTGVKYSIYYNYYVGTGLLDNATLHTKEERMNEGSYLTSTNLLTLPVEKEGYIFNYWTYNDSRITEDILVTENITLVANYSIKSYTVTFDANGGTGGSTQQVNYYSTASEPTKPTRSGYDFTDWYADSTCYNVYDFAKIITDNVIIYAGWKEKSGGCIVEGTLITMADGTLKPVEDLMAGDVVLVFNHYTGQHDTSIVLYNVHAEEEAREYEIINLVFSDGTILKIYNEHYLFDMNTLKYECIDKLNVASYINHSFYSGTYDGSEYESKYIKLVDYYITNEYVKVYGPSTAIHFNLYANGLINVPGDNDPWLNIFEVNHDLMYDQEKMEQDIKEYGLFTYEDFKDYISEDVYYAYQGQYLKIAIGKGYTTFERIVELIEKYLSDYSVDL